MQTTLTAADLCRALYSGFAGGYRVGGYSDEDPVACLSLGCYDGTTIPVRKVPADARVTVEFTFTGASGLANGARLSDEQGGWIADRFEGPLSTRETVRLVQWIEAQARVAATLAKIDPEIIARADRALADHEARRRRAS